MTAEQKGIKEGPPIWVESLMTEKEWIARYKAGYPSSTEPYPPMEFDGPMKWRKGMGATLTKEEIKLFNDRLDAVLKKAGIER